MYIVYSHSKATDIIMYYMGYVQAMANGRIAVQSQWTSEIDFATMFSTEDLAQRVADAFAFQHGNTGNIEFLVSYQP